MGEPLPRKSEIPIELFFQPVTTKYLEKRVVVEVMDIFSVRHAGQGDQELC